MKKFALITMLVLCVVMAVSAVVSADALKDKTFVIGFDNSFPPYGYVAEDGSYIGYDLDLAAEVAKRNGWEVVFQPIDWDSKDMELDSGNIDCIWNGFTMTEERLKAYEWTEPYKDASQVVVVKADSGIASLADLAGKVVVTQADSSALSALQSEEMAELTGSFAELLQVPQYLTAFMELEAGSADAIALDYDVAVDQLKAEANKGKYIILDEVLVPEQYGVGFKKGNTELRDIVQKTMEEMAADGTFAEISAKWFDGQDTCIIGK